MLINKSQVRESLKKIVVDIEPSVLEKYVELIAKDAEDITLSIIRAFGLQISEFSGRKKTEC